MARKLQYTVILLFSFCFTALSQQYYAILISGSGPDQSVLGKADSELGDVDISGLAMWHGIFSMWKTLTTEQGYSANNVYVLYKNGVKFNSDNPMYQGDIPIYGPANYGKLQSTLTTDLKNRMTTNDVLIVFTGGHGEWNSITGEAILILDGTPSSVGASEFASWVNQIPCRKRIFVCAQCMSGAFAPALVNGPYPTIAMSCGTGTQVGEVADNDGADGFDDRENEIVWHDNTPKTYYHWEFDYHVINAIRNRTFVNEDPLRNPSPDLNSNGGRSLDEVFAWVQTRETSEAGDPCFWDPRKLASTSYVKCSFDLTYMRPAAPTNVALSGAAGQHPTISWSANTEPDLAGYKVYRKIPPFVTDFQLIATVNNSTTSYTDNYIYVNSGSGDPKAYYYVKAYDATNRYSDASSTVSIHVHPPGWPKISPDVPEEPIAHQLYDAYPNPFNPSTTIRYALSDDAHVAISVFNTQGQELATLMNGMQSAGYHETRFQGEHLASGIYFVRMTVSDALGREAYRRVTKLLLTK